MADADRRSTRTQSQNDITPDQERDYPETSGDEPDHRNAVPKAEWFNISAPFTP